MNYDNNKTNIAKKPLFFYFHIDLFQYGFLGIVSRQIELLVLYMIEYDIDIFHLFLVHM